MRAWVCSPSGFQRWRTRRTSGSFEIVKVAAMVLCQHTDCYYYYYYYVLLLLLLLLLLIIFPQRRLAGLVCAWRCLTETTNANNTTIIYIYIYIYISCRGSSRARLAVSRPARVRRDLASMFRVVGDAQPSMRHGSSSEGVLLAHVQGA